MELERVDDEVTCEVAIALDESEPAVDGRAEELALGLASVFPGPGSAAPAAVESVVHEDPCPELGWSASGTLSTTSPSSEGSLAHEDKSSRTNKLCGFLMDMEPGQTA